MIINKTKIAIQKNGKLTDNSIQYLREKGIFFKKYSKKNQELTVESVCKKYQIIFTRQEDIPKLVKMGKVDMGIVGKNLLIEKNYKVKIIERLDFGFCKLVIACKNELSLKKVGELSGRNITTTYPNTLQEYLQKRKVKSEIITLGGSVEVAPTLGISEIICDLVETGKTLKVNKLREVFVVLRSQAVLITKK